MVVTRVSADTGGGNIDVVVPDNAANLSVAVRTGAGNVVVCIPSGVAARVHPTTGLGKVIADPRFSKADKDSYQTSDFDNAPYRVEITAHSGAGNVSINNR
jgi:predicted membrane protein